MTILGSGAFIYWLNKRDKIREQKRAQLSVANNVRPSEFKQEDRFDREVITIAYRINPYWIYIDRTGKGRVFRHPSLLLRQWEIIENSIAGIDGLDFQTVKNAAKGHLWMEFKRDLDYDELVLWRHEPMTVADEPLFRPLSRWAKFEDGADQRL